MNMKKERTLFMLGIWVAILPYLGFPNSFRKFLFIISGIILIYLSYGFRKEKRIAQALLNSNKESEHLPMKTFIDNMTIPR